MAQYYPIIVQAGNNLAGDSLGFHAYSLRVDNCTNQWYLEETSLAYIPPYSLGVCLRLYGTGVAILLNSAPIGQPQLARIVGEQLVGVYSDQLRTEVAPSPIRQFTLVQSVSDLTQGAQPATPPVGITRMWAAPNGDLHYLLSSGTDALLLSTTNYAGYVGNSPLGGDLQGTVSNGNVVVQNLNHYIQGVDTHGVASRMLGHANTDSVYLFTGTNGMLYFYSDYPGNQMGSWSSSGNLLTVGGALAVGNIYLNNSSTPPYIQNSSPPSSGVSIRYAIGSGGVHSFEAAAGGYGPVNMGSLAVNGNGQVSGAFRAGANTGYVNQYVAPTVFSSTVYNAWVATPISVPFNIPSGHSGSILVTYSAMVTSAVVGTIMYTCPALDGAISYYQVNHVFVANFYQIMSSSIIFTGLAAGAHTLTLYIQSNSGVWSIWNAGYNILTVSGLVS